MGAIRRECSRLVAWALQLLGLYLALQVLQWLI